MKPKLKPPGTKRLKLKCDVLAFKLCFQIPLAPLHHVHRGVPVRQRGRGHLAAGRGAHSFTSQLNLSRF